MNQIVPPETHTAGRYRVLERWYRDELRERIHELLPKGNR